MAINCKRILVLICFRSLVGCSAYFHCDCNNIPWSPIIAQKTHNFDNSFNFPHYDYEDNTGLSHYSTYKNEHKLFDNIYNTIPFIPSITKVNLIKPKEEIKEVREILDEPLLDKTLFFMPLLPLPPKNFKQEKMVEKEGSDVKKTTEVNLEKGNNGSKMENENANKIMDIFFKINSKKIEEMVERNRKEMPMKQQEQKKENNKVFVDIGKEFSMPIFPEMVFKSHYSQKYASSSKEETDHHHHGDKNVYYLFEYSINDKTTKDIKHHKEERKGDQVMGEYSLQEGDGNVRIVKYVADWKSGFHAQVHNSKKS